jgi:xanthine dehydrogenase accessory factor
LSEIAAVCRAWFSTSRAGEPAWLATVADVEGSSHRRPGARLIFTREALLAGSISGGCLEREIARTGAWLARRGPVVKVFDSRLDDDELRQGTGCEGRVHVLVEPLSPTRDGALSVIGREFGAERPVAVATVVQTQRPLVPLGARVVKTKRGLVSHVPDPAVSRVLADATEDALFEGAPRQGHVVHDDVVALVEVLEPPPHLFLFGAGADAVPVVRFGAETADEIALSIVAEAQSVLATASAGFLRERSGHINRRPLDGEERVEGVEGAA